MAEKEKERFEILIEDLKKDFRVAFDGISALRNEMQRGFGEVKEQIKLVDDKLKFVHDSLKNEIQITALAVKDELKENYKEVKDKLDEHVRQPAHAVS